MKAQEKLLILLVAAIALFIGQLFYQVNYEKQYSELVQVYQPERTLNEFILLDEMGQPFTKTQLMGKWSFVFLGYLSCPDICPMTMAKLSALKPKLQAIADDKIEILFVSVDPKRDTVDKRKQYVDYFEADIKGLGAEHKDLFPFVRNLGLMYSVPDENSESYYVDHSASVVLINPDGNIAAIFKPQIELNKVPLIQSETLLADFTTLIE